LDLSLIIFIAVVAFFTYRGFKKGLLKSLSRVLGLLLGYVAAILFSKPLSVMVETWFEIQGIVAYVTAALILFLGAGIIVSLLFWLIGNFLSEDESISTGSRAGGSVVGLITGTIVAVVIVWTFNFLNHMRAPDDSASKPRTQQSAIEKLANQAAGKAVETAMTMGSANPEIVNLSAAMIKSPAEITQQAQALANSNDLQDLLVNPKNQRVLNSGDVEAVRNLPALRQLASNPDMLALASSAGLLDQTNDTEAVEAALAQNITHIWGRVQRVKNDQRVQEILADPEFQQKINSGNPIDLLTNPKLLELADIILADEATDDIGGNSSSTGDESGNMVESKPAKKVFTWTDGDGRIHYSDTDPASDLSQ
jgi:uncharacterized membrane protein required for colicin V production